MFMFFIFLYCTAGKALSIHGFVSSTVTFLVSIGIFVVDISCTILSGFHYTCLSVYLNWGQCEYIHSCARASRRREGYLLQFLDMDMEMGDSDSEALFLERASCSDALSFLMDSEFEDSSRRSGQGGGVLDG